MHKGANLQKYMELRRVDTHAFNLGQEVIDEWYFDGATYCVSDARIFGGAGFGRLKSP